MFPKFERHASVQRRERQLVNLAARLTEVGKVMGGWQTLADHHLNLLGETEYVAVRVLKCPTRSC